MMIMYKTANPDKCLVTIILLYQFCLKLKE